MTPFEQNNLTMLKQICHLLQCIESKMDLHLSKNKKVVLEPIIYEADIDTLTGRKMDNENVKHVANSMP